MPSGNNTAVIAAAGSRKTQFIVESALSDPRERSLIVTYTNENQRQIIRRIEQIAGGVVPPHITVMGWFSFLINQCVRPYQNAFTKEVGYLRALNFNGKRPDFSKKSQLRYFFDSRHDIYRDGVADLAVIVNKETDGKVVERLRACFDHIYVDEVQDLVAFDLDFLDLLLRSRLSVTMVGDPRQHLYSTSGGSKNKKYRGRGLIDWFSERSKICEIETRTETYRSNQQICDFADALFPNLPVTTSKNTEVTGHDGVFVINRADVSEYMATYNPQVLRQDKGTNTEGLGGLNIGNAKGGTYDRVLVFPASTAIKYYDGKLTLENFKGTDRLYVAVTRARFSATLVR